MAPAAVPTPRTMSHAGPPVRPRTGSRAGAEGGDPVDRGAIMAALEAAAEAVVAAEAAADSADQAEAAADVAETAAELVVGRNSPEDGSLDPEAQAALDARVDAGGFEESYADRLAHLLPQERRATPSRARRRSWFGARVGRQHRELQATPRPARRRAVRRRCVRPRGRVRIQRDPSCGRLVKDAIPSMQGFAARVTGTSDGVVAVAARDPESEN